MFNQSRSLVTRVLDVSRRVGRLLKLSGILQLHFWTCAGLLIFTSVRGYQERVKVIAKRKAAQKGECHYSDRRSSRRGKDTSQMSLTEF